jgi:hypothetical protein
VTYATGYPLILPFDRNSRGHRDRHPGFQPDPVFYPPGMAINRLGNIPRYHHWHRPLFNECHPHQLVDNYKAAGVA